MTDDRVRVLVVDDHEVVRAGLVAMLERDPAIEVAGAFGSAEEALAQLDELAPDVVVLDHRLPGMSGVAACAELVRRRPAIAVVMLTTYASDEIIHASLAAGARAYLLKDGPGEDLVHAVRAAARGGSVLAPQIVGRVVEWARTARMIHRNGDTLSPNEVSALALVAQGMTYREIGRRLGVSESTVKFTMRAAMRKLGVRERSEAVAAGIRKGVI